MKLDEMFRQDAKRASKLAEEIVKLLAAERNLPVATTAITEVLAAWLVKMGPTPGDDCLDVAFMGEIGTAAISFADRMRDMIAKGPPQDDTAQAEARVAAMPTRPVRKGASPWSL